MTVIDMRAATLQEAAERVAALSGQQLTGVLPVDLGTWVFRFATDVTLSVDAPWRATADGRIVIGHADHGQRFGLHAPVNGAGRLLDLLGGQTVTGAEPTEAGDLALTFEDGARLEVFNASCGHEGWQLRNGERYLVGMGGGGFSVDA